MNNTSPTTITRSNTAASVASAESSVEAIRNNNRNNNTNNNNNDAARSIRVTDANTDRPAHQTVRFFFLSGAWSRISQANRVLLVSNIFITFAQLVSIVTVLVISRNQYCDKPLNVFLIVYLIRSVLNSPLVLYHHLRSPNNNNNNNNTQEEQQRPTTTSAQDASTTNSTSTSSSSPSTRSSSPSSPQATAEINTSVEESSRRGWTDRIKSLLDIFGIVWFIIGSSFLFTSGQCIREAPSLFYTTLVWILLGYLLVLIPLFLCVSVIFCFPCVLVLMRTLRLGYASGLVTGATKEEIENVPVYKYKSSSNNDEQRQEQEQENNNNDNTSISTSSTTSTRTTARKRRRSIFRWLYLLRVKQKSDDDSERNYDPITITPIEDAVCPICISEYEDDDLICKLWCEHHFHKKCVESWFVINSSCPLCKRDFRQKQPDS
ncbi:hypothetical protein INT45_003100 [Circinella minor]|uniref:RING-type domain-containing protein n=1 Tax=Circinella minor TaxID=1195481 RepID=A0A8H7RZ23_9FUNG|nr:hypothetical protein INT45_003100 [Circinella minor]